MKGLMKKLLAMGLLLALALTLGGCGVPAETNMAFSDEPPQLVERKYPETLEEFLREDRWDYRWDYYTDREKISPNEAMRLLGIKSGSIWAWAFQDGVLIYLWMDATMAGQWDPSHGELIYINRDGTGKQVIFSEYGVFPQVSIIGECTVLFHTDTDLSRGYETSYYYYYQPSGELIQFTSPPVEPGRSWIWGRFVQLSNADFVWEIETKEHAEWRKEVGCYGPEWCYNEDIPAVEYHAYNLITGKLHFLGFSTGDPMASGYSFYHVFSEPMFETWLETYRAQRDEDLAAME